MFGINLNRQRSLAPVAARTINEAAKQAERSARLTVGAGLAQQNLAGIPIIRRVDEPTYIVRIASVGSGGTAGRYGWQAIQPDPATPGAWVDRETRLSGTLTNDPLYEFNANASLTVGMRVEASRVGKNREMRFVYGVCS